MKPEVWVILDEKEARFLKTGGSIATTAEGGQHVRISYFPQEDEPDELELLPSPDTTDDSED